MTDFVYVNGWLLFVLIGLAGIAVERLFIDAVRAVARLKRNAAADVEVDVKEPERVAEESEHGNDDQDEQPARDDSEQATQAKNLSGKK